MWDCFCGVANSDTRCGFEISFTLMKTGTRVDAFSLLHIPGMYEFYASLLNFLRCTLYLAQYYVINFYNNYNNIAYGIRI